MKKLLGFVIAVSVHQCHESDILSANGVVFRPIEKCQNLLTAMERRSLTFPGKIATAKSVVRFYSVSANVTNAHLADFCSQCGPANKIERSQYTVEKKMTLYESISVWLNNVNTEIFTSKHDIFEVVYFVAELDRKIIAVNMLAYLMFPSTFEKHEHALLLFNLLLEKNIISMDDSLISSVVDVVVAGSIYVKPVEKHLLTTTRQFFGFCILKQQQVEVIDVALTKPDCLVVMSTGGGKSACFLLPGLV
ncbi:hypothetical protein DAPPUDRAFT_319067 [Daphnia pulex]|uniref:DEAD/DEAH box helicase domain-containing protein n=1 Tax=Daphnia pulex TaxID=6669 RepID=E9GKK6_DAPPU|nr:hypothetical protein DAPPUDRAFT_319067 [Daphnia pulex]|eukprot:EFX80047.1 hypothetical protein DAPPUDRAFT_319067 [Daphnia pulex]